MRVQKVNDSTIRIFISFTELADRDITMADLFQRSPKTEQLFWELIAQAREEVEFNLDQPFWIQATATSNEEFVITVMKQEDLVDSTVRDKEKRRSSKSRELAYVFSDFEDLLEAVLRLPEMTKSKAKSKLESEVFQYEGEYYLTLSELGTGKKRLLAEAVLDEFGERVDVTKEYLHEHGKLILRENAIQALGGFFSPSKQALN